MVVTSRSRVAAAACLATSDGGGGGGDGGVLVWLNLFIKSRSLCFQRVATSCCSSRAERKRLPLSPAIAAPPGRPPFCLSHVPAKATPGRGMSAVAGKEQLDAYHEQTP